MNQVSAQHKLKRAQVNETRVKKVEHKTVQVEAKPIQKKDVSQMTVKRRQAQLKKDLLQANSSATRSTEVKYRDPKRNKVYRD